MTQSVSLLTQSKFYSPAFNSAIFDGPLRIYFAQYQEEQALRIYFTLQKEHKALYEKIKTHFKSKEQNCFVMLYPSLESFQMSFGEQRWPEGTVISDQLDKDLLIGVRGPLSDLEFLEIFEKLAQAIAEGEKNEKEAIEVSAL